MNRWMNRAHSRTFFVTSPTSQFTLQPLRRVIYVPAHSPTLPLLHVRHSSFSNPSFVSLTSLALHLRHLASRPWSPPHRWSPVINKLFTAVGQAVACAPFTQRARVRSPVGTGFLGEVFFAVFPHLSDNCRETLGPLGPQISFGRHYHYQWSFITSANDLRCWRAQKPEIDIHNKQTKCQKIDFSVAMFPGVKFTSFIIKSNHLHWRSC